MSGSRIYALDRVLVDQIAAGEVVERPASVVKELVENSIDAGATRIEILLEEGGLRRIEIRDDGEGMVREDLELAVTSHATSKLSTSQDLESVATLGFRGEALASIAAVSRLEIHTARSGEDGACMKVRYGKTQPIKPSAHPKGTRMIVEDLFSELPARLKFMKRPSAELARCSAWVERLALAHLGVGFSLSHEGRTLLEVAPDDDIEMRCAAIFGKGIAEDMVSVEADSAALTLRAWVAPPESARRDATRVHIFLNGRWVRDPRLLRAVREGVREFVPIGHYPTLVLQLSAPPDRIDVNVHPQKTEVRFRDERLVMGMTIRTLREGLSSAPWATRQLGAFGGSDSATTLGEANSGFVNSAPPWEGGATSEASTQSLPPIAPQSTMAWQPSMEAKPGNFLAVAKTFLIREVAGGMEVLDQHALHERINLEELRKELREGKVVSQPLLVPSLVDVDRAELEALVAKKETFSALGVEIEAFGETTLSISAIPARLTRLVPERLVTDLLEIATQFRDASPDHIQEEMLHSMACRGAVMAGDFLDEQALEDLLKRGANLPQDRTCAHGRPVRVFVSQEDLERAFYRR